MKPTELQVILHTALQAHRAGNFRQAQALYEEFLLHEPYSPDVLYNLALIYIAQNNTEKAIYYLEQVLEKIPGHANALNNLGALLMKQHQHEQALQCFAAVLSSHPDHLEARNNIAAVLLYLGRYRHAAEHYRFLLAKTPKDIEALYNHGLALIELSEFEKAIGEFQKILLQHPEHIDTLSNMGIAYLKAGELEKARDYFQTVLEKQPAHPEIGYLYNAITHQNIPDKPPQQYIQHLFDQYAGHYEQHMVETLHYHVPHLLHQLLQKYIQPLPKRQWEILDLGCGTGLAGLAFCPHARSLTGVDLSEKMLDIAQRKSIYTQLHCEDLMIFLKKNIQPYDLLLASDTFNYFGKLDQLFNLCKSSLKNKASVLFSLESLEDEGDGWTLEYHGRYLHTQAYIEKIALQQGFTIIAIENSVLREQNYIPVNGFLCLFQT